MIHSDFLISRVVTLWLHKLYLTEYISTLNLQSIIVHSNCLTHKLASGGFSTHDYGRSLKTVDIF